MGVKKYVACELKGISRKRLGKILHASQQKLYGLGIKNNITYELKYMYIARYYIKKKKKIYTTTLTKKYISYE